MVENGEKGFIDPPRKCKFCNSLRIGIQEGRIYFGCGSILDYSGASVAWKECPNNCKE